MAKKVIQAQMQLRRDTAANWAASNPALLDGELGIVTDDPNLYKIGDGATAWNDLKLRGFDGTLVQTTGDSENAAMSQKAVTSKLTELESEVHTISHDFVVTNEGELGSRASKAIAITPSKGDVYVFEVTDVVNTKAVITLANAASPFGSATLKTIATISENGSFVYRIEDEYLETAKYIVFSHQSNTTSVVSYNAIFSMNLPQNRVLQMLSDSVDSKLSDLESDINSKISELAEGQNIVVEKEYVPENPAYGTSFNSARVIYDLRWEWKKGDVLKSVIIPSGTQTTTPSYLRIYNSDKVLKKEVNLGVLPANTNNIIDVSNYSLTLDDGDIVAVNGCWYKANVGETNFYDLNSNAVVANYTYGIGFHFSRIESSLKEAIMNLTTSTSVKVLCFGNSFTQDSMSYVPSILKNIAPNLKVKMGLAIQSACSLAQHLANFTGESQMLNGTTYAPSTYSYQYWNGDAWTQGNSLSASDILALDDWDIVTFQQNGGAAYRDWDTYFSPFIYKLHKSLFHHLGHGVKIGWLLTHGAYAGTDAEYLNHWEGTAANSKTIMENTGTSILFPYGTAVQNLRTTSLIRLGDGEGQNLCADSVHLQEGIGCLAAAYCNSLTILNIVGLGNKGVIGEQTRVDADYLSRINVIGQNSGDSGVIGITEDNRFLAQVAAVLAMKNPYEVTDMSNM